MSFLLNSSVQSLYSSALILRVLMFLFLCWVFILFMFMYFPDLLNLSIWSCFCSSNKFLLEEYSELFIRQFKNTNFIQLVIRTILTSFQGSYFLYYFILMTLHCYMYIWGKRPLYSFCRPALVMKYPHQSSCPEILDSYLVVSVSRLSSRALSFVGLWLAQHII